MVSFYQRLWDCFGAYLFVFVDGVNQLRIAGMSKKEAIAETGRQRLRPIMMTAMTTILGVAC